MLVRSVPSRQQPALGEHITPVLVGTPGACRAKEECQDVYDV